VVVVASTDRGSPEPKRVAAAVAPKRHPKPVAAAPRPKPAKPKPRPVHLTAVAAYDPEGDDHEKDELVPRASDGDPATYWTTETYSSWGWKKGVGLVLDAGRPVRLTHLVLVTDAPGYTASIRAG